MREKLLTLLECYENNDEDHKNMEAKAYLGQRVEILKRELGLSGSRLSVICGWHPTIVPQLISGYKTIGWVHAAKLHAVTSGFISARYTSPAYWQSVNETLDAEIRRKKGAK